MLVALRINMHKMDVNDSYLSWTLWVAELSTILHDVGVLYIHW